MYLYSSILIDTTTATLTTTQETTTTATSKTSPPPCSACATLVPVGVSDGRIPDSNMRSDSVKVNKPGTPEHTGPEQARLNNKPSTGGSEESGSGSGSEGSGSESGSGLESGSGSEESKGGSGAWEPNHEEGYLEIHFNKLERVKEIRTQGSPSAEKYTSRYFLFYTVDGKIWKRLSSVSCRIISLLFGIL